MCVLHGVKVGRKLEREREREREKERERKKNVKTGSSGRKLDGSVMRNSKEIRD